MDETKKMDEDKETIEDNASNHNATLLVTHKQWVIDIDNC